MTWENLRKADCIAEKRPLPDDAIEQIKDLVKLTNNPIEKAMIENVILSLVMFNRNKKYMDIRDEGNNDN